MYAQEKIKPYTGKAEKGKMVKSMFDTISPTYDKARHGEKELEFKD